MTFLQSVSIQKKHSLLGDAKKVGFTSKYYEKVGLRGRYFLLFFNYFSHQTAVFFLMGYSFIVSTPGRDLVFLNGLFVYRFNTRTGFSFS